jgi:TP901 family phage tail tape measure protein
MAGTLGRLMLELGLDSKQLVGGMPAAEASVTSFEKTGVSSMAKVGMAVGALAIVGGAVALGASSLKAAGDFQQATTQLVTGAGEQESALEGVRKGLLSMAGEVGTSATELSKGMYMIESAGYHGADGLKVLDAAAKGAKVGGAQMETMADALTTTLNSYHMSAGQAVPVTNQMVAAVAAGKMHMQDFAGALSAVLPIAASAKINFSEVAGGIATMTAQGMSAQQASQDLANTIRQLQNPSQVAVKEMAAMGIQSNDVATQLGKKGLTGTLELLTTSISKHMGPAGTVIMSAFNQSKAAAQDADIMLSKLPKSIQGIAHQFQAGSITSAEWRKQLKNLSPESKALAMEFAHTQTAAHAFNDLLRSGSPAAQTYSAALSDMLGGSTGLTTALMLTGGNMATFKNNVAGVADAAKKGGGEVSGWALVQSDFNTKMEQFKAGLGSVSIEIGSKLLPVASRFMDVAVKELPKIIPVITGVAGGFQKFAPILGGVLATFLVFKGALMIQALLAALSTGLGIVTGVMALLTTGEASAATASTALAISEYAALLPLLLVAAAIGVLVAAVIWAYNNYGPFRDIVNQAGEKLKEFGGWISGTAWPWVVKLADAIGKHLGPVFEWLGKNVVPAVVTYFKFLIAYWHLMFDVGVAIGGWIGKTFGPAFLWLGEKVIAPLVFNFKTLLQVLGWVWDRLKDLGNIAKGPVGDILKWVGGNMQGATAAMNQADKSLTQPGPRTGATASSRAASTDTAGSTYIDKVEVNHPATELDIARAMDTQRHLATVGARGFNPAPQGA